MKKLLTAILILIPIWGYSQIPPSEGPDLYGTRHFISLDGADTLSLSQPGDTAFINSTDSVYIDKLLNIPDHGNLSGLDDPADHPWALEWNDTTSTIATRYWSASQFEPKFTKNTAFNKNFGTTAGTVAEGNDSRILNGQTAYSWGNHSVQGYATETWVDGNYLGKTDKAADSDLLDGINSGQFLRSDMDDTMNGNLTVIGSGSFSNNVDIIGNTVTVADKNIKQVILSENGDDLAVHQTDYWNGSSFAATQGYGFGLYALQNNAGSYSNGFGHAALQNNTGSYSNGFGYAALQNNTGVNSSGFGYYALRDNTGHYSNGFGHAALQYNTGVNSNGFGYAALQNNAGSYSNGFGHYALRDNTGAYSSGFGHYALRYNAGNYNTGIGNEAGVNGTTSLSGASNTFLGANTSFSNANITNATAVGANVVLSDNNTVILGNNANVGIGTTSPSEKLEVNGNILMSGNKVATEAWVTDTAKAADADKLDGLESSQFLRSDVDDEFTRLYFGYNWTTGNGGINMGVDGLHNGIKFYDGNNPTSAQIYRDTDSKFYVGSRAGDKNKGIRIEENGNTIIPNFLKVGSGDSLPSESLDVSGNVIIGSSSDSSNRTLTIASKSDAGIYIKADTDNDNVTETHNPFIYFEQDGAVVKGNIGFSDTNIDAMQNEVAGIPTNSFVIHNQYTTGIEFAVSGSRKMTIGNTVSNFYSNIDVNGNGLFSGNVTAGGEVTANNINTTVQALSGTSVTWNISSGHNATITLSGNTTITFSNLTAGTTGNITVTNPTTAYDVTFSGYTVIISPSLSPSTDTITMSGNSEKDVLSWYYDGTQVFINGTLAYE